MINISEVIETNKMIEQEVLRDDKPDAGCYEFDE